jgi:hypothetical protein
MNQRQRNRNLGQALRFRPNLEGLEVRDVPSVTVTQFTDPSSGLAGLRVVENARNDTVTITDNSTDQTTTVVANGKTQMFDQQFAVFDLQLVGRKDALELDLAGDLVGRMDNIHVNLGTGENHFTFNPDQTAITDHSNLNLDILGHNGNDFVNLSFGQILESTVKVNARNLGGSGTALNAADVRDVITFGVEKTGVRNSSVDVNIGLGHGNNNLLVNYGIDLGHLAPSDGTAAAAGDFGPSTFNVNVTGSDHRRDVDNVMLFANGEVNTGSTLNFNTNLGAGNNTFNAVFDASTFQIDDDGGAFVNGPDGTTPPHSGGAAHFNVQAGSGNDSIAFTSIHQDNTIELSGLFDVNILGGSGKDNIKVDLGGAGFTDDDPFELAATNRVFRLRVDGGSGADTIKVNLANAATATFAYDVAIMGGSKRNDITFIGTNPSGGTPSFGPADSVFIDGGFGAHNHVDVFGNFPVVVDNAQ